ncbi:MAG: SRPBCC family protein [Pseudomonadota bacterium]
MPQFTTKRRLRHSAGQMFDLVADVERYPEFVPLCRTLRIDSRQPLENGRERVIATMTVAYKLIRETFVSDVELDEPNNMIVVRYKEGPFRELENRWVFNPISDERCELDFFLAYEFKSRMLERLMGAMFDRAFRKFATAFETRAATIYGRSRLAANS